MANGSSIQNDGFHCMEYCYHTGDGSGQSNLRWLAKLNDLYSMGSVQIFCDIIQIAYESELDQALV